MSEAQKLTLAQAKQVRLVIDEIASRCKPFGSFRLQFSVLDYAIVDAFAQLGELTVKPGDCGFCGECEWYRSDRRSYSEAKREGDTAIDWILFECRHEDAKEGFCPADRWEERRWCRCDMK